jgi:hypothetical protein
VDKALRARISSFEEALNAYNAVEKKGEEKFDVDGREYGSMLEYINKNSLALSNDHRHVGAKVLCLPLVGNNPPDYFVLLPDDSVVYRSGDEPERKLPGHDKEVMREVFGYLGRKQDKEITVVQDRGQLGAVREQDIGRTGADVSNTTVVRVKTPEAVEKLSRHGMHPRTVAVVSNEKDGYNLVVVFQHRGATRDEREKFVGQLKKVCPEVLATTLGDEVPSVGSAKDAGKLPGKFSVVLRTNSDIDLDKVLSRSRHHLKHQGQCLEL